MQGELVTRRVSRSHIVLPQAVLQADEAQFVLSFPVDPDL
ncbi:hypothetical protein MNBD_GAMMA19-1591 [hydrothermal vent metagenome]|uniref:Uncharacterized protein n=1 Tax=hydrothermal vent metagenome TaxID=652676 RepID=A0A3B0ZQ11_9ZZZZ